MISRLFRTSFLMLSVFLFSFIARASDGRIQPGGDPVVRCMGQGLPADKCKAMQDYALQIGCVTPGEYAAVVRYGFAPTCSPVKGPGLEQLASYCPCGCFHPDTLISVREWSSGEDGLIEAGVLVDSRNDFGLIHLSNTSRMSQLTQKASPILVTTAGKEKKDLVVIKTTSGKLLKLTEQHAVLTD
ncbi:MAG: hypothetical protein KDD68_20335, partial [Bdellovibrionales bacterium]|nr:hypothetical protein [Bdellovibrionales bacterium]